MLLKYFLSLVFVLTLSLSSYAQGFRYGFKAGIDENRIITNQSRIKGSEFGLRNTEFTTGFNINFLMEYQSARKFGFSVEPGFIRKTELVAYKTTTELNYLQLPILLDYYLSEKMVASVGPNFDYRIKSFKNYPYAPNRLDFGGIIAFRYSVGNHINLGIRYGQSLIPFDTLELTDNDGNLLNQKLKLFNQYFQVNVAYKI